VESPEPDVPEKSDVKLARWPVILVAAVVLVISAMWLSCQEYAVDRPPQAAEPVSNQSVVNQ